MSGPIELPHQLWHLMDGHCQRHDFGCGYRGTGIARVEQRGSRPDAFRVHAAPCRVVLVGCRPSLATNALAEEFAKPLGRKPERRIPSRRGPGRQPASPPCSGSCTICCTSAPIGLWPGLLWAAMALGTGMVSTAIVGVVVVVRGMRMHVDAPEPRIADHEANIPLPSPAVPPAPSASVARLVHTADCCWAADAAALEVGDNVDAGRKLVLKLGLAEVLFESGAADGA